MCCIVTIMPRNDCYIAIYAKLCSANYGDNTVSNNTISKSVSLEVTVMIRFLWWFMKLTLIQLIWFSVCGIEILSSVILSVAIQICIQLTWVIVSKEFTIYVASSGGNFCHRNLCHCQFRTALSWFAGNNFFITMVLLRV